MDMRLSEDCMAAFQDHLHLSCTLLPLTFSTLVLQVRREGGEGGRGEGGGGRGEGGRGEWGRGKGGREGLHVRPPGSPSPLLHSAPPYLLHTSTAGQEGGREGMVAFQDHLTLSSTLLSISSLV